MRGSEHEQTYIDAWCEQQFTGEGISMVGWMSVGVVDVLRTRVNGNVPERGPVYNRSGAGSGSVMDTDAKAVEELLTCSGRAGCVRGFCF
jgi:hypothetical protein